MTATKEPAPKVDDPSLNDARQKKRLAPIEASRQLKGLVNAPLPILLQLIQHCYGQNVAAVAAFVFAGAAVKNTCAGVTVMLQLVSVVKSKTCQ